MAIKVKPLEWREDALSKYKGFWFRRWSVSSKKLVGDYRIDYTWKVGAVEPTSPLFYVWMNSGVRFTSLDEAKAAAQADYERRILSAIEEE